MDQPQPTGLKPTLRQMMIVVLWAALLIAGIRAMIRWQLFGNTPEFICLTLPMLIGLYPLPILAGLLWLLDRPGRVRRWYSSGCMIATHFLGGVVLSLQDPVCYALTGRATMTFPMAPTLALVGFWCGWMQWRTARPRPCPSCGRNAVIPVAHLISPRSKRKYNTGKEGWCASCGASCEREGKREWRLKGLTA